MTSRDPDDTIRAWFKDGPSRGPARGLDEALARLATAQRPRRRELRVPLWIPVAATTALLIAGVVGFGAGLRITTPEPTRSAAPSSSASCQLAFPVHGRSALLLGSGFTPNTDVVLVIDRADGTQLTLDRSYDQALHTDRLGGFGVQLRPYPEDLGHEAIVASAGCEARLEIDVSQADLPATCPDPQDRSDPAVDGQRYRAAVATDSPLHWWPLDDSGDRGADTAGSDPGTYTGTIVHAARSALSDGGAAFFNGHFGGAFTAFTLDRALALGDFTIEAWVYMCHYEDDGDPIVGSLDSPVSLNFGGGSLRVTNGIRDVVVGSTVATGRWQHWAVTRDAGVLRIYLDGALDATSDGAPWTGDFPIDMLGEDSQANLVGYLDEVAIYDRALAAERIAAHAHP